MRPVRLVIADDSAVMLEALAESVVLAGEIDVVGLAPDAESLVASVREHRPDVVLLDLRLGDRWGFDLVPELRALPSGPEVVVLSALADERTEAEAARVGAFGQLAKGCSLEEIRTMVLDAACRVS